MCSTSAGISAQPGSSRGRKAKVFGSGSRAAVAVLLAVKDPAHTGDCELHHRDIGDYLSRDQRLEIIDSAELGGGDWTTIKPNEKGEWLNQSSSVFQEFAPLGDKTGKSSMASVSHAYGAGLRSNRDSWVYNYSTTRLDSNIGLMTKTYDSA